MEYVIGALLLASFFGLAVYAVRGGNLMIGMLIIGTLWTVLPLFGNTFATNPDFIAAYPGVTDISFVDAITKVYQSGPEGWGSVLVNVVFGAWFGRVLLETGIADALIRKTVELGGDKPIVISVLLSIVTTAIFSTLFGAGAVVAIGVIILPILMSLGIPKVLAVGSFMMSVGAGMYLNPVLSGQFLAFFLDENGKQLITYDDPARLRWAVIGMLVQLGMVIVMTAVSLRKKKTVHAWVASAARRARPGYVPTKALIAPILPVLLLVIFKVPIILGFTLASLYAMLVCGKMKSFRGVCRTINKDFYDGVVDTAPLVGFLLMIPIFNKSAELCVPYFNALRRHHPEQHTGHQHLLCGAGTPWLVPRSVHPVRLRRGYAGHSQGHRLLDAVPVRFDGDSLHHDECLHLHDPELDRLGRQLRQGFHP